MTVTYDLIGVPRPCDVLVTRSALGFATLWEQVRDCEIVRCRLLTDRGTMSRVLTRGGKFPASSSSEKRLRVAYRRKSQAVDSESSNTPGFNVRYALSGQFNDKVASVYPAPGLDNVGQLHGRVLLT